MGESKAVSFQLRCPGCAGPVELTIHGAHTGQEACVYCGDLVALPEGLAAAPEPVPRPPNTPIVIERNGRESLRVTIPPRRSGQLSVVALLFGLELAALALAHFVHAAFVAPACFLFPALYFVGRESTAGWSSRLLEVTGERVTCTVAGPYAWLSGKRRAVHSAPLEQLGGIAVRVLDASDARETRALLIDLGGGNVRILAISPDQDSEHELRWLHQELQRFLDDQSSQGTAPPRPRQGVVEIGFALACVRCDSALEPSAADLVRGALRCEHCQTQSILAPRLRRVAGIDRRHRHRARHEGSPIELRLGPERLVVVMPPRGWTPMLVGQGLAFGSWVGTNLSAALAFALADMAAGMFLALALGLFLIPALLRTLGQVYGTGRLSVDAQTTSYELRCLGLRRRFQASTAAISARYLVPGQKSENSAIVHRLQLEGLGRSKGLVLGHGQFGDEWTWLASEINAFKASVLGSARA